MVEHTTRNGNCRRKGLLTHSALWTVWAVALFIAPAIAFTADPHTLDMRYYLWTSAIPLAVLTAALAYALRGILGPRRRALVTAAIAASALYAVMLAAWYVFASQSSIQELAALTLPEWILRYASWMLWGLTLPLAGGSDFVRGAAASAAGDEGDRGASLLDELDGADALTVREHEVARLLLVGLTMREAADRLDLSPSTVATYRSRACEKLGIASFDELAPAKSAHAEPAPPASPSPTARPLDLDSRAVPTLAVTLLCLALLSRGLLVVPRAGLPILALALTAPAVAALILRARSPRTFAVRPTRRAGVLLAGAVACGFLVGGAPGFANLGVGIMGHAQYVSGYLIALVFYLAGAVLTLGMLARESTLAEVAAADPAALEAERCILYLRGRGSGEMQAQALLRIARGDTTARIAEELHIAPGTVNAYRARGYQLLDVHSARELAQLLVRDTGAKPPS